MKLGLIVLFSALFCAQAFGQTAGSFGGTVAGHRLERQLVAGAAR